MNCQKCLNQNCFIKYCSPKWLALISERKSFLTCSKNQYLFYEGQPVTGAYLIFKGEFKIVSTSRNGRQHIVRLAKQGQILGHRGYGDEFYPIGAISLVNSQVCFIDNNSLTEMFMHNAAVSYHMMRFYADELRKSELRAKAFAQMKTAEKIIYAIIYTAETFGLNEEKFIQHPLSRIEFAEIVGTNAEQVSRTLRMLKQKGLISLKGRKIGIPDIEVLKAEIKDYHWH
ncbi:MAG: Crp/Fnr family transcriptional regulator [Flavobacteriales bacterium]|nr:Crp/Fnr family transcriptional regulator [Flavobacteriales bacterium]